MQTVRKSDRQGGRQAYRERSRQIKKNTLFRICYVYKIRTKLYFSGSSNRKLYSNMGNVREYSTMFTVQYEAISNLFNAYCPP
jgi:hypothetical protein